MYESAFSSPSERTQDTFRGDGEDAIQPARSSATATAAATAATAAALPRRTDIHESRILELVDDCCCPPLQRGNNGRGRSSPSLSLFGLRSALGCPSGGGGWGHRSRWRSVGADPNKAAASRLSWSCPSSRRHLPEPEVGVTAGHEALSVGSEVHGAHALRYASAGDLRNRDVVVVVVDAFGGGGAVGGADVGVSLLPRVLVLMFMSNFFYFVGALPNHVVDRV